MNALCFVSLQDLPDDKNATLCIYMVPLTSSPRLRLFLPSHPLRPCCRIVQAPKPIFVFLTIAIILSYQPSTLHDTIPISGVLGIYVRRGQRTDYPNPHHSSRSYLPHSTPSDSTTDDQYSPFQSSLHLRRPSLHLSSWPNCPYLPLDPFL